MSKKKKKKHKGQERETARGAEPRKDERAKRAPAPPPARPKAAATRRAATPRSKPAPRPKRSTRAASTLVAAAPSKPPAPPSPRPLPVTIEHAVASEVDAPFPPTLGPPQPRERDIEAEIRALEAQIDQLTPNRPPGCEPRSKARGSDPVSGPPTDTATELLSEAYVAQRWGKAALRSRFEPVDEFGYDKVYEERAKPLLDFLYESYFRVEVHDADRVPNEGRAILVANHAGTVPLDGPMLRMALQREHPKKRELRWLAEDFVFHMPFLGAWMNRIGAVRACQENAERLLQEDAAIAVFPEGAKGVGKLFRDRYRLQRFGRGGFIKLALRTGAPVVPVAIVGGEETNPLLFKVELFAKSLGLPFLPVTPTFPLLGPAGLLPAPTKWRIFVGEPLDLSEYGEGAAADELLVGRLSERVRATIQGMLDRAIGERRSVWFG